MSVDDEAAEEAVYLDTLLNDGIPRTHTCEDGMVIVFPGDGRSFPDLIATERNRKAMQERVQADSAVRGSIKRLEARITALEGGQKRGQ